MTNYFVPLIQFNKIKYFFTLEKNKVKLSINFKVKPIKERLSVCLFAMRLKIVRTNAM